LNFGRDAFRFLEDRSGTAQSPRRVKRSSEGLAFFFAPTAISARSEAIFAVADREITSEPVH
jgi:hypothetical protein